MAVSKDGSPPPSTPPEPFSSTPPRPDHASSSITDYSKKHQEESSSQKTTPPIAKIEEGKHQTDDCNKKNCVISIQKKLDELPQPNENVLSSYSISSAPQTLKEMDSEAFRPKIISIGPLHRGCDRLQPMQAHKLRFLRHHLARTGSNLELFINTISPLVDQARKCYADHTHMISDQEFMEMLLLDSCFILELLCPFAPGFGGDVDHLLFSVGSSVLQIQRDMLLLENQIPLLVLNRMFEITTGPEYRGDSVSQLAIRFFRWTVPGRIDFLDTPNTGNKDEQGVYLLHVIWQSLITLQSLPRDTFWDDYSRPNLMMRCVSFLRVCGEKFKKRTSNKLTDSTCVSFLRDSGVKFKKRTWSKLTDIKFERGILKIPPLLVDDDTKSIFLNLMAFEQCHSQCSDQISSYIVFMDRLINTPDDVAYLQQKGIIRNCLGSKEDVAQLFNDLSRRVIDIDYTWMEHLSSELDKYLSRKRAACRASLELTGMKRKYFSHPWTIISVVAAVLMIGLTLTQTLYSILSYHVGHS